MTGLTDRTRFNLENAHVMLLEPYLAGLYITSQILAGLGVTRPQRCEKPESAMQLVQAQAFDLIVCDASLPDGAAYDFVAGLRRSELDPNRYCPVIMLAGHTPLSLVAKARDCGANFVVAKPLSPRVLLERIFWIAQENRPFVELEGYVGPDRRFQNHGPPETAKGRRRDDGRLEAAEAVPRVQSTELENQMIPVGART